jgi:hypothetical protein
LADAPLGSSAYAKAVIEAHSAVQLASAAAPLFSSFGDDLTLWRDGHAAHWAYDGQSVIVEQQADGAMTASFVDAPSIDEISGSPAAAVYRRTAERNYQLTADSCAAMVGDMIAFLSGEREPFFTFVSARSLDA